MKKYRFGLITLMSVFVLGACSQGNNKTDSTGAQGTEDTTANNVENMPLEVKNDGDPIEGETLDVAVVMDTQFQGLFQWEFYQDTYDRHFMSPSHEYLFLNDDDFKIVDGGPADLELDQENKIATITLRDNLKWSDGEEVTAEDVIFAYEVIGHADYTGIRYDNDFTNVIGMEEYHAGESDTISGITAVNDKVVQIEYKEVHPGMMQSGGGVWMSALAKHTFEGIEIKDMESSDPVRKNPIGFGPYVMSNIVAGETVEYVPNEYYYGEKPTLDKIVLRGVPSASINEALNAKQYDIALSMPTDTFDAYKNTDGYQMLGRLQQSYTYLGFKLGTWDAENKTVAYDPNSKMANKALRQAMGYAVDNDAIGERFYHGLRTNATTLIPPVFGSLHNEEIKGYTLDLDKANQLLDDAGYIDTDGDGFREDPDGNKLTINFASMSGGETAQPLADYYVQQWNEIGLDVQFSTGRLIDFQAFYDKLENDDPDIDVFMGAWNTGSDPSPTGLWGPNSPFNYTRYQSDKNTELLAAIDLNASFDEDKRKEAFDAWQEYAFEEAFAIPTLFRSEILPISDRVTNFSWAYDVDHNPWAAIGVTDSSR
ncbi:oligopeptide ABC transporter substrate-binding protein [Enterococcus gallinarum]|uniref:oligopeptide ABC transporter substrate-binding protein n=1 Tax=Enterococcus gallinarum TaxID=1353 RepID=UPI001C60A40C|nr:oligopeptide ABC transporter substrate-binding protein [Enterococcus gallinarum]MBW5471986.1 oligopeptide ABC transporter substrate-binding protein [Enterococcus gallinarum]UJA24426.1 oligopeptide ABC transporter substrate-binding protein [Enterococcus gallinarum]